MYLLCVSYSGGLVWEVVLEIPDGREHEGHAVGQDRVQTL